MNLRKFAVVTMVAQAAMLSVAPANATVIYNYTGNNFTNVFAPGYTTTDKITGTLTLSSALPALLSTLTNEVGLVVSYSFSDGVNTFTKPCCDTGNQTVFDFITDASGNITNWNVTLETNDNHTGDLTTQGGISAFDQSLVGGVLGGGNAGNPGTWSVQSVTSAVPEPTTWALFLVGLGAIGRTLRNSRKEWRIAASGQST